MVSHEALERDEFSVLHGLIAYASGEHARGQSLIDEAVRLSRLYEVPIPLGIALQAHRDF